MNQPSMIDQHIRQIVQEELLMLLSKAYPEATPKPETANTEPNQSQQDLHTVITNLLNEIGIPIHIKGYNYLREAIAMGYHNPDILNNITKILNPTIAEKFNTTPSRVERSMRHAIETTWTHGNVDAITQAFGYSLRTNKYKPVNGQFIAMVVDKLRIERKGQ